MIKRIVKMTFQPEKVNEFKSVFEQNWKLIKSFPGCSHVELLQVASEPNVFFTYSIWDHEDSLNRYRDSELFAGVWGRTKVLFSDRPEAWTVNELTF